MRALVIDDSRATRAILRRMLEGFGCEVSEAVDGSDALAVIGREAAFDLALVDWNMPVMNGLQFVEAVRGDGAHDGPLLVMVTTEGDTDHMIRALEAGADEYVMKPFTAAVIKEKLRLLGVEL